MSFSLRFALAFHLVLLSATHAVAQEAADLLNLLPGDFAVTVIVHDLKSNHARWEKSAWWQTFRASVVGKRFFASPEMQQFERWQADLKKHFLLDWPALRDDVLGGDIVLSYSPGDNTKPDSERGIVLLRPTKHETLKNLIDRLNEIQHKTGELKSLTALKHAGAVYHRRVQGGKAHFYAHVNDVFAITPNEDSLKDLLARRGAGNPPSPWVERFRKAGADRSVVTLCVNPRRMQPDFGPGVKKTDELPSYWRALDAIFVTMAIEESAELRICIQAKTDELPTWARASFTHTLERSDFWDHLPERSLFTIAGHTDFVGAADALRLVVPENIRGNLRQGTPQILLDIVKDTLPNLGPDWGAAVLPARNAQELPRALFALRVKPSPKKVPVDEVLLQGINILAGIRIEAHNKEHPNTPIQMRTATRGGVEVKYLESTKFPRGFQPAWTLKEGYLLVASSLDTIDDFRKRGAPPKTDKYTPILRLSTTEAANLLDQRRDHVLATLTRQPGNASSDAKRNLENVISLFQLFDTFTLSQHGSAGQTSWMLRLTSALPKN